MNARQKAKRYKHMYEELVNKPVERYKIDRLRFKRAYPRYLVIDENSSYFKEIILKDIALSLDKYIDYHTEFYPHANEYCFVGEIKVVEKEVKE